jgi:hypothetical protein
VLHVSTNEGDDGLRHCHCPLPQAVIRRAEAVFFLDSGEISAYFCGQRMLRGQHNGSLRPYSGFSRPDPLLFLPSSSSVVLSRLSGPVPDPPLLRKSDSAVIPKPLTF